MNKLKYFLILGLTVGTVYAKKETNLDSNDCQAKIANAVVLYSAQLGKFDNPNSYAADSNYSFNPLMNTLVNESLKQFRNVRQSDILPISALGSAMQAHIVAQVPKAIKTAAIECNVPEQDMTKIISALIKTNDPEIKKITFSFIQNYVTDYLQDYGY